MKIIKNKFNALSSFYVVFVICVIIILFYRILNGYPKESWQITEWLINYQGGFVRRGLAGEVLLYLSTHFGINPYYAIILFCLIAYFILVYFFVKLFLKNGYTLFILPFAFFLGGPVINDFVVRKDVLIILLFISAIYFSNKKSIANIFLINIFLITGLLVHEEIGFFSFPVLFLILLNNKKNSFNAGIISVKSMLITLIQLFPALITFGFCLYNKGSLEVANQVWQSWKPVTFPIQNNEYISNPAAIDGLSWSFNRNFGYTINTIKNFHDGFYAPFIWTIILIVVYYIASNTAKLSNRILSYNVTADFDKTDISNILVFQFITFIPLFILGCDYGRWVFLWITSSFAIILLLPHEKITTLFPKIISSITTKANNFLDKLFNNPKELPYFFALIIGVPFLNWALDAYLRSNAIVILLKSISKLIEIIFHVLHWGINS